MFRRFLNNSDYKSLVSKEHLEQAIRNDYSKLIDAELNAEMALLEYLTENYEIEKELAKGKYIVEYDRRITFPVGAAFYLDGQIYEVIKSIAGYQKPSNVDFWEEFLERTDRLKSDQVIVPYSQFDTYQIDDLVTYNETVYICRAANGYKFDDIRIPLVKSWKIIAHTEWLPVVYDLWAVVQFEGHFYTAIDTADFDNNKTPLESDCWGLIGEYDPQHNEYDDTGHDYVVLGSLVFVPELNVNSELPESGVNIAINDPRNQNIKKHLSRIAAYEIMKLIAPNNVSTIRVTDNEESMKWLLRASKLQINPHIPRKLDVFSNPVTDWQMATFQTEFDPYKNPWLT